MFNFIKQSLSKQKQLHRYRQRTLIHSVNQAACAQTGSAHITMAGKAYVNFSSNDYLALNNHPLINKALAQGAEKFGVCATGSSLLTGYHYAHQALEETICTWLNKPKCLLFNSGFSANNGVLQALGQTESYFYLDKLSHASIIDGAYQSKAQVKRFRHNDLNHLKQLLNKPIANLTSENNVYNRLIVSEGVFSMDGDCADIAQLQDIAKQNQSLLYIDDAHSIGVLGKQGEGSASIAETDITMATFGKALATSGAFVACSEELFEYLLNFSRHYIYSTAMSPAMAWATKQSIEIVQQDTWRREKVQELSNLFQQKLSNNVEVLPTNSSIHAIIIGSEEKTLAISEQLKNEGIWLSAIRPPTVAEQQSRLRVTICADHNSKDINKLAESINKYSE